MAPADGAFAAALPAPPTPLPPAAAEGWDSDTTPEGTAIIEQTRRRESIIDRPLPPGSAVVVVVVVVVLVAAVVVLVAAVAVSDGAAPPSTSSRAGRDDRDRIFSSGIGCLGVFER